MAEWLLPVVRPELMSPVTMRGEVLMEVQDCQPASGRLVWIDLGIASRHAVLERDELALHATAREQHYLTVDPGQLARSLPGFAEISDPVLVAVMGRPGRFRDATRFKSHAGLAPRASQTGDTDCKGQPMSKAGPSMLRATLFRAAATARRQDPQLARIYHQRMTERGANHLKASCVVAGHLAERAWTVLSRGTPHVICDNNGTLVTAQQARQIIAEKWTLSEEVRKCRRSRTRAGKAPQAAVARPDKRGDLPRPRSSRPRAKAGNPVT